MKNIDLRQVQWSINDGYRKTVLANGDDLGDESTLTQIVAVPPGSRVKPHFHRNTHEFIYVIGGEAALKINDETRIMKPGDMIVTQPGDVHEVVNEGDHPWEVLVFKTNYKVGDSYWPDSE
jgi:quercetin dioxygenase-like cupin family protein